MKTVRAKQSKVLFANFVQHDHQWNNHKTLNLTQSSSLMWRFRCRSRRSFSNWNSEIYSPKQCTKCHFLKLRPQGALPISAEEFNKLQVNVEWIDFIDLITELLFFLGRKWNHEDSCCLVDIKMHTWKRKEEPFWNKTGHFTSLIGRERL